MRDERRVIWSKWQRGELDLPPRAEDVPRRFAYSTSAIISLITPIPVLSLMDDPSEDLSTLGSTLTSSSSFYRTLFIFYKLCLLTKVTFA